MGIRFVFHARSPLFLSILMYYDKTKQNQTKHQFSSPQLRHVPSGTSRCPRPHLAGSFSSSSHASLWIDLQAPAPPTAAEPREGDPSGAEGAVVGGWSKEPKEPGGAHQAFSLALAPAAPARSVSGAFLPRKCVWLPRPWKRVISHPWG